MAKKNVKGDSPLERGAVPASQKKADKELDRIATDVTEHYAEHLAGDASPSAEEFVGRLRADLKATADVAVA